MERTVGEYKFTIKNFEIEDIYEENEELIEKKVKFELKGLPTDFINAIRRVATDELPVYAFSVESSNIETSEEELIHSFLIQRIECIPIRYNIDFEDNPPVFMIDVVNNSSENKTIYSRDIKISKGKLNETIFSGNHILATITGKKKLRVKDIVLEKNISSIQTKYNTIVQAHYNHLDIPEYSFEETHLPGGKYAHTSGYTISSAISNPKHHLFECIAVSVAQDFDVYYIFISICNNIRDRFMYILNYLESDMTQPLVNISYISYKATNGQYTGILTVENETWTTVNILKKILDDHIDGIMNREVLPDIHTNKFNIKISSKEDNITDILKKILMIAIEIFEKLFDIFTELSKKHE